MREINEGIRVARHADTDSVVFKATDNQGEIFAALDALGRNTAATEEHP